MVRNLEIRVIKHCTQPGLSYPRRVATGASCRIAGCDMVGDVRAVCLRIGEIRLVAAVTIGRGISRGVIAADVAVRARVDHRANRTGDSRARRQHVRPLQRETRRAVVKLAVGPEQRVVAGRAKSNGEPSSDVVRNVSAKGWCIVPIL